MDILLDVHTHTIASGHAFSSLQEMVKSAAEKRLRLLGITEHTPGIPGTCDLIYFRNLHVVPRKMYGVELLLGAETNIKEMWICRKITFLFWIFVSQGYILFVILQERQIKIPMR